MDKNDIAAQRQRYKDELLRLYGKNRPVAEESHEGILEETETEPAVPAPLEVPHPSDDSAYSSYPQEDNNAPISDNDNDFNNRYPTPDLSGLDTDLSGTVPEDDKTSPQYASEEALGSSTGRILVNVRTGDESAAVENATVMVTAIVAGNRFIVASGQTNMSGTTEAFEVPAPAFGLSQAPDPSARPYTLYDVSVTAEGFFPARSVDVPVFSGITSVQNFSMIPVPAMMNGNGDMVTYFNQEPDFGIPPQERR